MSKRGERQTPEHIATRIAARRANGAWHSQATKDKIAQTLTGRIPLPESREKQRLALKGRKQSPEHTTHWVESRRAGHGWHLPDESRTRMSATKKAQWAALSDEEKAIVRATWKANGQSRRTVPDRTCEGCGVLLTRKQIHQGRRFHAMICRNQNGPKRLKRVGEERRCERCGIIVWVYHHRLHNWHHCSLICRRKPLSEKARDKLLRCGEESTAWRLAVYQRDGFQCQDCGSKKLLHAHHLKSWSKFPDLRFEVSNGITVCLWCHKARHHGRYIPDRRTEGVQLPRLPRIQCSQMILDL